MMDVVQLQSLIDKGEALEREFKSDRSRLSDQVIYEEVVAFANTNGGVLLIGVEDDGEVTGAKPRHGTMTDTFRLQSAIFNNTVPNINTRVSVVAHLNGPVLAIEVDSYPEPCATTQGRALRRAIGPDGKPQTLPYYPRDQRSRRVDLGLLDFSAQPLDGASFDNFDPLEFERLRQTIVRLRGDTSLLDLSDEELAQALQLVETRSGRLTPNIAGILLLGREDALHTLIPTHEVNFQVLDPQGNVRVNDSLRGTLLRMLNELEARFVARNEEQEVIVGMLRLPIPDYSPIGFREAVNNALLHRDYTRLGAVFIQWHPDHLLITNPGGLPEGITLDNLLVHEPKPRNPRLSEAAKRIGLIEKTGRGVDKIFMGQLRYGRPAPDYTRTDPLGVRVVLYGGPASLQFSTFVYEQDQQGRPLTLDELLVLNTLFLERRVDSDKVSHLTQKGTTAGRIVLERLQERGLIEAKGERRGRVYHLSAALYRRFGQPEAYVRTHDIDRLRQEGLVIEYLRAHGRIRRGELMRLLGVTEDQARRILERMRNSGKIELQGKPPRWTYYTLPANPS